MTPFQEKCMSIADVFEFGPGTWTQIAEGRNSNGKAVSPWSDSASKWCLSGAVSQVMTKTEQDKLVQIGWSTAKMPLPSINDSLGKRAVLRLLRVASGEVEA